MYFLNGVHVVTGQLPNLHTTNQRLSLTEHLPPVQSHA